MKRSDVPKVTIDPRAHAGAAFLNPPASLLAKLGSIVVHAQEMIGSDAHHFDRAALFVLLDDPEVVAWLALGRAFAMIPEKRRG